MKQIDVLGSYLVYMYINLVFGGSGWYIYMYINLVLGGVCAKLVYKLSFETFIILCKNKPTSLPDTSYSEWM